MTSHIDRNCLSYWFPRLVEADVPVPQTEIVRTDCDLTLLLDGETPEGWGEFLSTLSVAIAKLTDNASPTPPIFLRTGHGSGKHNWRRTCYVDFANGSTLPNHVAALVEWSHMVDFLGLPHDVWCVREMLPVKTVAILPACGGMPLVKEIRTFVRDGKVVCHHPYWPIGAIADGFRMPKLSPQGGLRGPSQHADASVLANAIHGATPTAADEHDWRPLAEQVAKTFAGDGAWSVDLLPTARGWHVTDMAEAHRSFHWDGCSMAKYLEEAK